MADRHQAAGVGRGRTLNNYHSGPAVDPRSHGEPSHQPGRDGHSGGSDAGRRPGFAAGCASGRRPKWQPWLERDSRIQLLDSQLERQQYAEGRGSCAAVERATLLAEMGRSLEARSDHLKVLELEPAHRLNLFGLGRLLVSMGQRKAAQMVYAEAVKYLSRRRCLAGEPGQRAARKRRSRGGSLPLRRQRCTIDPEFLQAHGGMYYALTRLGEPELARLHQEKAFGQKALFPSSYRGDAEPIPVLLLVSSTGGNTPIEKLIDDRIFQTYVVVADFYDTKTPLPLHRLVINGIGDCDAAAEALLAAESLLAFTSAPVLNPPAAVRATGRCENASRLGKLPGIKTPVTVTFLSFACWPEDGASRAGRNGFTFPLLLRTPGFHMGQHFVRVESAATLGHRLAGCLDPEVPQPK